jgi:hypothetical protein
MGEGRGETAGNAELESRMGYLSTLNLAPAKRGQAHRTLNSPHRGPRFTLFDFTIFDIRFAVFSDREGARLKNKCHIKRNVYNIQ